MDQDSSCSTPKEADLYDILGIHKSATDIEIKKAYRKAALQHHPDKVPEERRAESEVKFKSVTEAYEILRDEEKRQLYDHYGMSAFNPLQEGGRDVDLNDMLAQMFGVNISSPDNRRKLRKGRNEERTYKVKLEELYKGKTVKFVANKYIVCNQCKGSGAKSRVKHKDCDLCKGTGARETFRQVGPSLVQQEILNCSHCHGSGLYYKEKDRCKTCKGVRTTEESKVIEIHIPPGSKQGERIVLEGEADQFPGLEPGDIIFTLAEEPHKTFFRHGNDLLAELKISLSEALTGFSRVVLKHLDGRGIFINHFRGNILRPTETIRVAGEGMPLKRSDLKGDLYLRVKIDFPENGWLKESQEYETLRQLLPPVVPFYVDLHEINEVKYEANADIKQMGVKFANEGWKDERNAPECTTQ